MQRTQKIEVKLTDVERLEIERRCLIAIEHSEDWHDKLRPRADLKDDLIGSKKMTWFMMLYPTAVGIFGLLIWRWLFEALEIYQFLKDIGLPSIVVNNLPEIFVLFGTAAVTCFAALNWGASGRIEYANRAENASRRASVIYSVIEELSDILPGAIPDLSEYRFSWNDDDPNDLVERALGRYREARKRPTVGRPENPFI